MEQENSVSQVSNSKWNPSLEELSFEQKIYRVLKNIDASMLPEYMESFGLEESRASIGLEIKALADTMSEEEFIAAIKHGKVPTHKLSPVEIEVLYRGSNVEFETETPAPCPSCAI